MVKAISLNIILIQKYVRRHLLKCALKHNFPRKLSKYHLIYSDFKRSKKEKNKILCFIKYDEIKGYDSMKYYDLHSIESLRLFNLLVLKAILKEKILLLIL